MGPAFAAPQRRRPRVIAVDRDAAGSPRWPRAPAYTRCPRPVRHRGRRPARPRVDVLVNDAGIQHVAPIEDFPPENFELILRLMLQSPFLLIRAVCRACTRAAGAGWSTSPAPTASRPAPFKSAYVSAKHGLEGLSKVIALEGAATA